jgi:hypothetical protein
VAHGGQQRGALTIDDREIAPLTGARAGLAALVRRLRRGREGAEHALVFGEQRRAPPDEAQLADRDVEAQRRRVASRPARALHVLPLVRPALPVLEHHALHAEGLASPLEDPLERLVAVEVGAGERRERLRLAEGVRRRPAAPNRELHRAADHHRHRDEHAEREGLVALLDVEGVERLDEEVVDQQRAADGGQHGDQRPADQRDEHHHEEVEQDLAFE